MPAVVTFDPVNLIIEEINTGLEVNETDLFEIYSEWKDWLLADPGARLGYPQAFRQVGSDPISDIQNLGATLFIGGGWKLRPAEYDHQWLINGNLFTDPAGERRTVPTIGAYTVEVTFFVSNLVDASVARLDLAQLQEAVFLDVANGVSGTAEGVGTPTNPSNNITDATTIGERDGVHAISITGSVTLTRAYTDWRFVGTVSRNSASIDYNGFSCLRCSFDEVEITGDANGQSLHVENCKIGVLSNALGYFQNCGLTSVFSAGSGGLLTFIECYDQVVGSGRAVIDLSDNLADNLQVMGWHGGMELRNVDVLGQTASIHVINGDVLIDSTNIIQNSIMLFGKGLLTDNAAAGVLDATGFFESLGGVG